MRVTRREWIGMSGAAAGLIALPPAARALIQGDGSIPAPVLERIRRFAEVELAEKGFPGMQLAIVGPGGAAAAMAVGLADHDARTPARSDQLFQIGSISKSLAALTAWVLAERGQLDLDATVQALLRDDTLPPEPITVRHLLEHSSGLPNAGDDFTALNVPGRRLWTGFTPGSRYSYCNLGYALLGRIIARAAGMPYSSALERLVLRPIGMTNAKPAIRTADRALYVEGHSLLHNDRPWLPRSRLTEARWIVLENAAGSVAATGADMVAYLRFIGALARGHGTPLFSDATAARFATGTIDQDGPGRRYGNGLTHLTIGERPMLRHTGGMAGFSSSFTLDRATGIGAYASVNAGAVGPYRPNEVTEYAVALLLAGQAGQALPERAPSGHPAVPNASRYAGRWLAADGTAFFVTQRGGALFVTDQGIERPFLGYGPFFLSDHPAVAPYFLAVEPGEPAVLRLGSRLFGLGRAPAAPPTPQALTALTGTYFNPLGWGNGQARVDAIGDQLYLGFDKVVRAADGSWRFVDPDGASERFWFEDFVDGVPQRLNVSGSLHRRLPDA